MSSMAKTGTSSASAALGRGKGTSLITPNLADWPGSCLVIDPKGEVAAITAERRRKMGQRVYILNPFGVLDDVYPDLRSDGFNPLTGLDAASESFPEDAYAIAEAYVEDREGMHDAHWIESARDLVASLILFECAQLPPEQRTLGRVREMLGLPHTAAEGTASLTQVLDLMSRSPLMVLRNKAERYRAKASADP